MLREVIERNINNNYNVASLETGISELILKEFLKGNAKLTIYDTENILKVLNIKIDNTNLSAKEVAKIIKEKFNL